MENNTVPNTSSNRIHPLVAAAAVSVMLVSLTGVAALTGLIPTSHSSQPAAAPVATTVGAANTAASPAALVEPPSQPQLQAKLQDDAPAPAKPAPVEKRAQQRHAKPHAQPHRSYAEPTTVAQAPAVCHSCGRVEAIQAIEQHAQPSGVGMVAGAVLGGVLGNQVGGGNGRKLATVAGAVGGGYAGNEVEKRSRGSTSYKVTVRMEDGEVRTFPYTQQPGWSVGDRVRIVNGQLAARG